MGLYELSKLTENSPVWAELENRLGKQLSKEFRQIAPMYARTAMWPSMKKYLFIVHHGDQIFESGDIGRWLQLEAWKSQYNAPMNETIVDPYQYQ